MTIFTFLLASQDAFSSACTWLFQLVADRPDLLERVYEESLRVRGGSHETPLTMEMVDGMTVTCAIVKETLRYRPPAIMFPYIAKKDYPITDRYTIPKGAMVCPSIYPALHDPEAYSNPDTFDPDRWITGNAEKQTKNWLVFGTGSHDCMGQNYAILSLTVLIANASLHLKWKHRITPESEEIKLTSTIYPKDGCLLAFDKRV